MLVIGFESGSIEVRKSYSGDVIFETKVEDSVAKIFFYDYRMNGQ